jgi:hypothetical protein
MNNPIVDFLRSYGPSAASDALYDEHVRTEVKRFGVSEIAIPSHLVPRIAQLLTDPTPPNVILTGTAGDGKTYHVRKIFLDELEAPEEAWPGADVVITLALPNGRELRIIRDLSEVPEDRKKEEIGRITDALLGKDTTAVYLVAANDGQLLKLWRDAAQAGGESKASHQQVYEILSRMLLQDAEAPDEASMPLRLFNLSRRTDGRMLDDVIDAALKHPKWEDGCASCPAAAGASPCPIRLNRSLLLDGAGDGGTFRRRLGQLFDIAAANGRHVPIRQVFSLVVNIVLGDRSDPDRPLLNCEEARSVALEGRYRDTNPYDNALGANLRSERRQNNAMFSVLDSFGLGSETNNAIDDLLLNAKPEETHAAISGGSDATYGERLFSAQRNAYMRGGSEAFSPEHFRDGLQTQRRRLFFRLPTADAAGATGPLSPWCLTIFHHGGLYLDFRQALKSGGDQKLVNRQLQLLIRGLNRTLTGMMADDSDHLWLAGAVGRTDDPTGRITSVDPIPIPVAGGTAAWIIHLFHDDRRRLPVLTLKYRYASGPQVEMPRLELRPTLFEYLIRVANGSLPASFSRQCHQETRRFALMLTQALVELTTDDSGGAQRLGLLQVVDSGRIQRDYIEVTTP